MRDPIRPIPDGTWAVVEITLDTPAPTAQYPGDVCDIRRDPDGMTGIEWLVNLDAGRTSGSTPTWGTVSCGEWV